MCCIYLDPKWYGYNPMRFLLESLIDLNNNLSLVGGRLYILQGNPVNIFKMIKEKIGLNFITYEQVFFFIYIFFKFLDIDLSLDIYNFRIVPILVELVMKR